jgi:prophage DNA circulation protein
MNWLKRLQKASFRGVEFSVESAESTFTRRIATDVFPGTDNFYSEDVARNPSGFNIEGFLVGSDYDLARDALVEACSQRSPGDLIHPNFGKLRVHCQSLSVHEHIDSGGYLKFTASFVESSENIFPRKSLRPSAVIINNVTESQSLFKRIFIDSYAILSFASDEIDAIRSSISSALEAANEAVRLSEKGFLSATNLAASISDLNTDIDTILNSPIVISEILDNSLSIIRKSSIPFVKKCRILSDIFKINKAASDSKKVSAGTRSLAPTSDYLQKLTAMDKSLVLTDYVDSISRSGATAEAEPISEEEWRLELKDTFDAIASLQADTESIIEYESLEAVSNSLLKLSESDEVYSLPNLYRYRTTREMPFLLAVFEMYGNVDRAFEVMKRNKLENPYYLDRGKELVYLK